MESSSNSKTRSPARLLAAFLAFVMVFIVMPTTPVWAVGNSITKIVFEGLGSVGDLQNDFFTKPNSSGQENTINYFLNKNETKQSWGTLTGLNIVGTADTVSFEGWENLEGAPFYDDFQFGFYASTRNNANRTVYYYVGDEEDWKVLPPDSGTVSFGRTQVPVYTIDNRFATAAGQTIHIKVIENHTVTFTGASNNAWFTDGEKILTGSRNVFAGDTLNFSVIVKTGNSGVPVVTYTDGISAPVETESTGTSVDPNGTKYSYSLQVNSNYTVSLTLEPALSVNVDSGNFSFGGSRTVPYGSKSYTFTVTPNEGYEIDNVQVLLGGETVQSGELSHQGGKYTYTPKNAGKITESLHVIVKTKVKQITITVTGRTGDGYTTNISDGTIKRDYGADYSFTVTPRDGYNAPKVEVMQGGWDITPTPTGSASIGFTYTLHSLTEDITITITQGEEITYSVTFLPGTGYTLEGATSKSNAKWNEQIEFTVKPAEGYTTTLPRVTVNGQVIAATGEGSLQAGWKYSFNVNGDMTVAIEGFELETYSVTIASDADKYNLTTYPYSVRYGEGFTFTLTLTDAFEAKNSITVKNDNTDITDNVCSVSVSSLGENGRSYRITISNVKQDLDLSFEGIKKKTYTVKVEAVGDSGKMYTVTENGTKEGIEHGNGVNFTITPNKGYRIDNVSVYVTDSEYALSNVMTNDGRGTYSIDRVTSNYTIKVSASPILFTITILSTASTKLNGTEMQNDSIVKEYTVENAEAEGVKIELLNGSYKLTLPSATRPGYKLTGWKKADGSNVIDNALTYPGTNDREETVTAVWKINTKPAEGEEATTPFVLLNISRKFENGKDVLTVRHEASNISAEDVGETVTLIAHGMLYGITKQALDEFSNKVENGEITSADFQPGGAKGSLTKFSKLGDGNVFYSYHDDSEKKTGDMLKDGHHYTEKVGNANNLQGCAVAFMIVKIGDETYFFYSKPDTWGDREVG